MLQSTIYAKKLTTARLYGTIAGGAWFDFGNVIKHKREPEVKRTPHVSSLTKGFRIVDDEILTETGWKYTITLDEHFYFVSRFLFLSGAHSEVTQDAVVAPNGTITFADVKQHRSYFIGKKNITDVVVKVGETVKTLDTDYTLDAVNGIITIQGGSIADLDDVTVTYGCPALLVTRKSFNALSQISFAGEFKLAEYQQEYYPSTYKGPRAVHHFLGQAWVSDQGELGAEKAKEYVLTIRALNKPTVYWAGL
jgi:hypothetical protein